MKKKFGNWQNWGIILLALCIPALLALANFETRRYATLNTEVKQLEEEQANLIEENKKLVSNIGIIASSERIEKIAVSEYGMRLAESDEIIRIEVKGN